jgi:hypothetical protein
MILFQQCDASFETKGLDRQLISGQTVLVCDAFHVLLECLNANNNDAIRSLLPKYNESLLHRLVMLAYGTDPADIFASSCDY